MVVVVVAVVLDLAPRSLAAAAAASVAAVAVAVAIAASLAVLAVRLVERLQRRGAVAVPVAVLASVVRSMLAVRLLLLRLGPHIPLRDARLRVQHRDAPARPAAAPGDHCLSRNVIIIDPRRVQRWSSLAELLLPASSLTRNSRNSRNPGCGRGGETQCHHQHHRYRPPHTERAEEKPRP